MALQARICVPGSGFANPLDRRQWTGFFTFELRHGCTLKYYLEWIRYLRSYIHFYAQLAEPLKSLKIALLKGLLVDRPQRRAFSSRTKLSSPPPWETASFSGLQEVLSRPSILVYYHLLRKLRLDLDASKEFIFGAILDPMRQGEDEVPKGKWPWRSTIEPLLFLSRVLSADERNYRPIKLEIARFV